MLIDWKDGMLTIRGSSDKLRCRACRDEPGACEDVQKKPVLSDRHAQVAEAHWARISI